MVACVRGEGTRRATDDRELLCTPPKKEMTGAMETETTGLQVDEWGEKKKSDLMREKETLDMSTTRRLGKIE